MSHEGLNNVIPGRPEHPIQNHVFLPSYQLQPLTMPPIRSESSQKLANQEGKILLALSDLNDGRVKSLRAAAKLYAIPLTSLHDRVHGQSSRVDSRPSGHKLTQLEEDSLVE
jgi:hypothetical protein